MNNEKHLTLENFLRLYLVPEERVDFEQHLVHCPDCLERFHRVQREMRDQAAEFQQQIESVPESFWATQRHQILWRVRAQPQKSNFLGLFDLKIWATVAAIFVFSVVLIRWTPRQPIDVSRSDSMEAVSRVVTKDYRDELLLRQVNQALNEDQADPLQPLDLIVKVPDKECQNADKEHYHEIS
ncbi:MAG TPA: hypothetical protein VGL91_21625 [Acidobacteriota bacterium]|jgi:hypothetical protein